MLNKSKKDKIFSRRIFVLAGMQMSLLLGLIARLYYLQIVKASEFATFSDSNRIKMFLIPPLRGKILDRNGLLFAGNENYYRAMLDPETAVDKDVVVAKLAKVLHLDNEGYQSLVKRLKEHKSRRPLVIYEHLNWDDVARVEVNAPDLPGVFIEVGQIRNFPSGAISSHVIGYMGPVSEKEIAINPLLNHPDFKIGRDGMERAMEQELRGIAGVKRMEVNAHGLIIRELDRQNSKPGNDVTLTLDRRMQEFMGKRLEGVSASSVLMNAGTGEVLGMVSTPGFDPSEFTYGVSKTYWHELNKNVRKPLINKAVSNQYPPGSTFKLVVALAALKDGVDPDQKINCPGYMDLGRTRFHCWKDGGHGLMDMTHAIMNSCNTYFFHMAKRIGVDKIAEMSRYFGMGEEVGIMLSGETAGLIPDEAWKKKRYKDSWQMGDTLNVGIGQGYVLATTLQLAQMVSRVAGGKLVKPYLVKKDPAEVLAAFSDLDIPVEHLDLVRRGMEWVINVPGGTAYGSRIMDKEHPEYSLTGKTGTSQVISRKGLEGAKGGMTPEELEKTKNHALFVGFGPVAAPKYAVAVIVEHGERGSKAAAPVGRDILWEAQKLGV